MADITYPGAPAHLDAFITRIKASPSAVVTNDWLTRNANIKGEGNARSTLSWLKATGILDEDGKLSADIGRGLLSSEDSDSFKAAMRAALERVLGPETFATLTSGTVAPEGLAGYVATNFKLGDSAVGKTLRGLAVLATKSGDPDLIAHLAANAKPAKTASAATQSRATGARATRKPAAKPPKLPPVQLPPQMTSPILNGALVQFRIDGTWKVDDIREVLRLLQAIEGGEKV